MWHRDTKWANAIEKMVLIYPRTKLKYIYRNAANKITALAMHVTQSEISRLAKKQKTTTQKEKN